MSGNYIRVCALETLIFLDQLDFLDPMKRVEVIVVVVRLIVTKTGRCVLVVANVFPATINV